MIAMHGAVRKSLLRVLAVGSVLAFFALLGSEQGEAAQPSFQVEGTTGGIYAQRCAPCHGVNGEGGVGPSLRDSTITPLELATIVRDGRSAMPAFGSTLSAAELDDLVAFSFALRAPGAASLGGAELYSDNCAECHGDDGQGGIGPNLRLTTLSSDDVVAIVRDGQGTMPGFADRVDPDDIAAMVAFVEELSKEDLDVLPSQVESGARLFTENCSQCHGAAASGGTGPALRTSTLTSAEMVSVISNGRGTMPDFLSILTPEGVDAVVAYVDGARTAVGDIEAVPSALEIGEDIYLSTCATCHAVDGSGGLGPALGNTNLTTNEIISQVFGGHSSDMPAFEGVLDPLQAQDVARYVSELEGETGAGISWVVFMVAGIVVVAVGVGLWYSGLLDQLWRRFR